MLRRGRKCSESPFDIITLTALCKSMDRIHTGYKEISWIVLQSPLQKHASNSRLSLDIPHRLKRSW